MSGNEKANLILKLLEKERMMSGAAIHRELMAITNRFWTWGATMSIIGGLMAQKEVLSPILGYFRLYDPQSSEGTVK